MPDAGPACLADQSDVDAIALAKQGPLPKIERLLRASIALSEQQPLANEEAREELGVALVGALLCVMRERENLAPSDTADLN